MEGAEIADHTLWSLRGGFAQRIPVAGDVRTRSNPRDEERNTTGLKEELTAR